MRRRSWEERRGGEIDASLLLCCSPCRSGNAPSLAASLDLADELATFRRVGESLIGFNMIGSRDQEDGMAAALGEAERKNSFFFDCLWGRAKGKEKFERTTVGPTVLPFFRFLHFLTVFPSRRSSPSRGLAFLFPRRKELLRSALVVDDA